MHLITEPIQKHCTNNITDKNSQKSEHQIGTEHTLHHYHRNPNTEAMVFSQLNSSTSQNLST